jgi:hypothetical protein
MPWYYAGPEAKPVGPISAEELHACALRGVVKPETYVIEQTGQPIETMAWRKYQEIFSAAGSLPPLPPLPRTATPLTAPPMPHASAASAPAPLPLQPHPLFPSAAPLATTAPPVFPPAAQPDPYYQIKPTNGWCAWGFGFGLAGFFFAFACGVGIFPALIAVILCIVGLVQLQNHREQTGHGLAVAGLILSGLALLISLIFILWFAVPMIKAHGLTVTEQTPNDSE